MTELYGGKYRVPTARAQWHAYDNGVYFVTICTQARRHWFGEIGDGMMRLSAVGQAAYDNIMAIPSHFPYVQLGAFVVKLKGIMNSVETETIKQEIGLATIKITGEIK